jgi:hypothetical protein
VSTTRGSYVPVLFTHLLQSGSFFLFAASCFFKLKDFPQFIKTIRSFKLLPDAMALPTAILILGLDLLVIGLLFKWSVFAFALASILLLVFTVALSSVVFRNLRIRCHCFGTSQHSISSIDLFRNAGFLICTCSGGWLTARPEASLTIEPLNIGLTSLIAFIFTLVLSQLSEIYHLFHRH